MLNSHFLDVFFGGIITCVLMLFDALNTILMLPKNDSEALSVALSNPIVPNGCMLNATNSQTSLNTVFNF